MPMIFKNTTLSQCRDYILLSKSLFWPSAIPTLSTAIFDLLHFVLHVDHMRA